MTSRTPEILQEALKLPKQERLMLCAELRDSVAHEDTPEDVEAAWREVIIHRIERLKRGQARLLDGNEVYQRLRAKYAR